MSIPIDKLYHYIESVAKEFTADVVVYYFYPHGSRKIEDLKQLQVHHPYSEATVLPHIYCYDQEPLNYWLYSPEFYFEDKGFEQMVKANNIVWPDYNFIRYPTIYDKVLLLHSELRSENVELYSNNRFIPVYYWSHAIISLDWYRYAKYEQLNKAVTKTFLIYNRSWSGTREYRMKLVDLLIDAGLTDHCLTKFNVVDPESHTHYSKHTFVNEQFKPANNLDFVFQYNYSPGHSSADYDIKQYNATDIELVLETLFDDERIQLTEKILRPIALGQPFLLAGTQGSLRYLQQYGFKTFGGIIDESYDTIADPLERLTAIVQVMKTIANWSAEERATNLALLKEITDYNKEYFFSNTFFNLVTNELKTNLQAGIKEQEESNTASIFIKRRKDLCAYPDIKKHILSVVSKTNTMKILQRARKYYMRTLPK